MARYRWLTKEKKWIEIDGIYKDPNAGLNGAIWCPENGYFDPILNRRFETKREKRDYMRTHGLMMEGGYKHHLWNGKKEGSTYFSYPGQMTKSRGYRYR